MFILILFNAISIPDAKACNLAFCQSVNPTINPPNARNGELLGVAPKKLRNVMMDSIAPV
jgi:hypothetical protein